MGDANYKPISCDYVDYIEHLATLKKVVTISYRDNKELKTEANDVLLTWKNENGEEFLYTKNGLKVRLDHIVAIDGKGPDGDCKLESKNT